MKYFAIIFFLIFVLFAALQLNDPDPVLWVTIYLVPAYVCLRAFKGWYNRDTLIIVLCLYLAFACNSLLQMTAYEGFFTEGAGMDMKTLNQELIREASGVLIVCAVIFVMLIRAWLPVKHRPIENKADLF
jgi:hypothetical protein